MGAKPQVRSKKSNRASVALVSLTKAEIRRLPKPRRGFERLAPEVVALYKNNHDKLALSDVTGDDITDALAAYQALRADEVAAQQHLARVRESRLYYAGKAYGKMLEIYNRCQRVGRKDADIKRAIAGFAQIMKRMGKRKAKPATASGSTPTPITQPSGSATSSVRSEVVLDDAGEAIHAPNERATVELRCGEGAASRLRPAVGRRSDDSSGRGLLGSMALTAGV